MNLKKLDKINNIVFHDGDIYNYERESNNISFEIKDGCSNSSYYKIKLDNVRVEVMDNNPEYICYTLHIFSSLNDDVMFNLYSGEAGIFRELNGQEKYYLKLWIRRPNVFNINCKVTSSGYKFDGMDVSLCNDYDDTGMLYIKFISDNIKIEKLYPLLDKYSRFSYKNINNLHKYKNYLGENEYKFFSAISLYYVFDNYSYIDNILKFKFRHVIHLNDTFTLSFLNISIELNEINFNKFIADMFDNERDLSNCIRFIEYKNNKYVIGLLISMDDEIIFTCDEIIFDGNELNTRSFYN